MVQVITPKPVEAIRSDLRRKYQDAFDDGARCAFLGEQPGEREKGGYPLGFHDWPLEKHNAWFAGYNVGRLERLANEKALACR